MQVAPLVYSLDAHEGRDSGLHSLLNRMLSNINHLPNWVLQPFIEQPWAETRSSPKLYIGSLFASARQWPMKRLQCTLAPVSALYVRFSPTSGILGMSMFPSGGGLEYTKHFVTMTLKYLILNQSLFAFWLHILFSTCIPPWMTNPIFILMSCAWSYCRSVVCQCHFRQYGRCLWKVDILWRRYDFVLLPTYNVHDVCHVQLTCVALEWSTEKHADFAARIGTYEPEQLVFVDESAVDRRTTYRGRAWAIRGKKATRKAFFCRGWQWIYAYTSSFACWQVFSSIDSLSSLLWHSMEALYTAILLKVPLTPNYSMSSSVAFWMKCILSLNLDLSLSWIIVGFISTQQFLSSSTPGKASVVLLFLFAHNI